MQKLFFEAIGTSWEIWLVCSEKARAKVEKQIHNRIDVFDKNYSRFRSDSLVTKISKRSGTYNLPSDAQELLDFYHKLYRLSKGSVTPLVGNMMEQIGYDAHYSLVPQTSLDEVSSWEEALTYNAHTITLKKPVLLDVGAAGKGYLVDCVADVIEAAGIEGYLIDAGGDMLRRGLGKTERIGLENPFNPTEAIGVFMLGDGSICASATQRRAWGDWHHIVDPHKLQPAEDVVATWVVAERAMWADGLATALFFCNPDQLRSACNFDYVRIFKDGHAEYSNAFKNALFEEVSYA